MSVLLAYSNKVLCRIEQFMLPMQNRPSYKSVMRYTFRVLLIRYKSSMVVRKLFSVEQEVFVYESSTITRITREQLRPLYRIATLSLGWFIKRRYTLCLQTV